jgi:hypothetical protein
MQTRARLNVLTLNRGDHANYDALHGAVEGHAVAFLQEMMAVQHMIEWFKDDGLRVWGGNRPDSSADLVVWDPRQIKVLDKFCVPLLPAAERGGTRNMAKSWNGIRGIHRASGRIIVLGTCHNIQDQKDIHREVASLRFNQNLHERLDQFRCSVLTGADWNISADGPSLAPFRRDTSWNLTQLQQPITTFGKSWGPDGFVHRDAVGPGNVLRFEQQDTIKVEGTDHKGLSARFTLDVK